ncbi:MAG: prolyl oligopeptidase family serine peptidase [Acidobacteriota bacterium]
MLVAVDRGFLDASLEAGGEVYSYQVFVPYAWSPTEEWPVILFLHGAGERGTDGRQQVEVGLGPAVRRQEKRFPALVVFPQCRPGLWWTDPDMEQMALAALDAALERYNGDRDRVYLTGISMGGYGTFHLAARHPQRFAAAVPICGGVLPPPRVSRPLPPELRDGDPYRKLAERLVSVPLWVFHGSADPIVPVTESRRIVAALRAAGGRVKYTEYPGVGHNAWDRAYAEPGLFGWMLSHRK